MLIIIMLFTSMRTTYKLIVLPFFVKQFLPLTVKLFSTGLVKYGCYIALTDGPYLRSYLVCLFRALCR